MNKVRSNIWKSCLITVLLFLQKLWCIRANVKSKILFNIHFDCNFSGKLIFPSYKRQVTKIFILTANMIHPTLNNKSLSPKLICCLKFRMSIEFNFYFSSLKLKIQYKSGMNILRDCLVLIFTGEMR